MRWTEAMQVIEIPIPQIEYVRNLRTGLVCAHCIRDIRYIEKSIDDTGSGLYQYWCVAVLVLVIMTRMLILIKYIVNKHILFLIGKYHM